MKRESGRVALSKSRGRGSLLVARRPSAETVFIMLWIVIWVVTAVTMPNFAFRFGAVVAFMLLLGGAMLRVGVRGWFLDIHREYNDAFKASLAADPPWARAWSAAMLPVSVAFGALTVLVIFHFYELDTEGLVGQVSRTLIGGGTLLTLTIGFWRRPRFLLPAHDRARYRAERRR